ncbi:MAG: FAD-binding domain-containing protein [Pseudomonadota bacterium]
MQESLFPSTTAAVESAGFHRHQEPLSHSAATAQLVDFLPRAGRAYARDRNFDLGDAQRSNVSGLSPFLRYRLITELDVLRTVLGHHSMSSAEKFVQEVFWRTYFKGWLEHRPEIWNRYREHLGQHVARLNDNAAAMAHYQSAVLGETGIEAFDCWANELTRTNYLHNHARMWFASIWIFTLRLPWELGADFFMTHLLDGDPASNTLSWRWVAGLHTQGKHYLARANNIDRYTGGRFAPGGGLDEKADPLPADELPAPATPGAGLVVIEEADILSALTASEPGGKQLRWLIHEDDLHPESLVGFADAMQQERVSEVLVLNLRDTGTSVADPVAAGIRAALDDVRNRLTTVSSAPIRTVSAAELVELAQGADGAVYTAYPPVGPVRDTIESCAAVRCVRRHYDALAWPHCRKGFFQLKTRIPKLLDKLL